MTVQIGEYEMDQVVMQMCYQNGRGNECVDPHYSGLLFN